jgi:hypothetical protein
MRSTGLLILLLLAALAGCESPRVDVETRLTQDARLWPRLDGPTYAIRAPQPLESGLAFEEFAGVIQQAFVSEHPQLRRVPAGQPADLTLGIDFAVADLGVAMTSRPVYAHSRGYAVGPHGGVRSYGFYGPVGTAVEPMQLGFAHSLTVAATVSDPAQPGGKRVLWEGTFTLRSDSPDLGRAMPYLAVAAAAYYGQATGGHEVMKFKRHDPRLEALQQRVIVPDRGAIPAASAPER